MSHIDDFFQMQCKYEILNIGHMQIFVLATVEPEILFWATVLLVPVCNNNHHQSRRTLVPEIKTLLQDRFEMTTHFFLLEQPTR